MNIQQFQYVLSVARFHHFETAADHCHISQSTLSTMILKFEDEIGITIFDRKKRPMEITKEGEQIIHRLKIITKEIERLEELALEIKGEIKGVVKLGCIPTVAPFLLPLFLVDFANKYPQLKIEVNEITTEEIIRRLDNRDLDIGIVSLPIEANDMIVHPMYDEPFFMYDTGAELGGKIGITDIDMDNFWLLEEGHCMRDQILDICDRAGKTINSSLNISFKAGSIGSLIRFVNANKGRTLLPALATKSFSEEEKKYIHYFNAPIPYRTIALMAHKYYPKKNLLQFLEEKIVKKVEGLKV